MALYNKYKSHILKYVYSYNTNANDYDFPEV